MKPRAVFITVMPSPYQRELFWALHCDGRLDIQVLYCTETERDRQWSRPRLHGFEQIMPGRTFAWLGQSAHYNPAIIAKLHAARPDVTIVSGYSAPTTQIAMRYLAWRRTPWVFWGELPGFTKRRIFGNLARAALQVPIRNAAAIAAIGTEAVCAYEQLLPGIEIFNIPYFCDLKPFFAAAKNPHLEHRTGPIKFLYSGQIIERKGVDVLIRAFAKAASQAPNIRLEILGAGPLMDTLKSLAQGELRERISFIGFRQPEEIPAVFAGCDVFVLPSRHDGWGVVVNEALGAGLSLVVSDRVGARDLVVPGVNGFVVKAGDVDALASVILRLATSHDLRKAQRRASKTMAAKWDVDEGVRRWLELTSRVLSARQCPTN